MVELINLLVQPTLETLAMVFVSAMISGVLGSILGVLLVVTQQGKVLSAPWFYRVLNTVTNIGRGIPFIILMVAIIPLTRWLVGTAIGTSAAMVCMMGIAFSVIPPVMWPSVAYIVEPKRLGTAFALMTLIEQAGFFALNLWIGKANDYQHAGLGNMLGYRLGMLIFSLLGFVGLTFAILLRMRETGPHGHGLNRSPQRLKRKSFFSPTPPRT